MFLTSFKGRLDILSPEPHWFFAPTLDNYPAVFIDKDYLPLVYNSLIISLGSTVLSIIIGAPAAYVFARSDFPAKEDLFFSFSRREWLRRSRSPCRFFCSSPQLA